MLTKRKQPIAPWIPGTTTICLMLTGLFLIGCQRDSTSAPPNDGTTSNQAKDQTETGVVLRANPNPVPSGTKVGKTTITWQTGSDSAADVYFFDGQNETLFASGSKGSKEASF